MFLPCGYHIFGYEIILVQVNAFLNKIVIYLFKGSQVHLGVLYFAFIKKIFQEFEFSFKQLLVETVFVNPVDNQVFPLMRNVINTLFILFNSVLNFQAWENIFEKFFDIHLSPVLLAGQTRYCGIFKASSHQMPISIK